MADNQGIFNRGETISRAQQEYDVYDFIANKPRGGHQRAAAEARVEEQMQDRLSRIIFGDQSEGVGRASGRFRPLIKMMIKSAAALPVLILFVGPRKVAQVAKPIFQQVMHLIPHLMQNLMQQLNNQMQHLQPAITMLKKAVEMALQRIKTTMEMITKGFNRAREFVQDKMAQSIAQWNRLVQSMLRGLLPERFSSQEKLAFFKLAAQAVQDLAGRIKEFAVSKYSRFADDIKNEIKEAAALMQKVLMPAANFFRGMQRYLQMVPETLSSAAALMRAAREKLVNRLDEQIVQPWKKIYHKAKSVSDDVVDKFKQIPEMVIPKIQIIVTPMINLLAVTQQFVKHRKEKLKLNLIQWFRHMNQRFQHYAGRIGEIAARAHDKIRETLKGWVTESWLVRVYRWFLAKVDQCVAFFIRQAKRVCDYIIARKDVFLSKSKQMMEAMMRGALFVLRQIPSLLYKLIEWAFGRPGILVLKGVGYLGHYALRALRYFAQLIREVAIELVRWGEA